MMGAEPGVVHQPGQALRGWRMATATPGETRRALPSILGGAWPRRHLDFRCPASMPRENESLLFKPWVKGLGYSGPTDSGSAQLPS